MVGWRACYLVVAVSLCLLQVKAEDDEETGRRLPARNLWPVEMQFGKTSKLHSPRAVPCINVPLDLEIDCPEAQTCGCESSILRIILNGEKTLMESRIDEISDVFDKDLVTTNLTLCDFGKAGSEVGSSWFTLETSLTHSHSEKTLSYSCRNVSDEGKFKDCSYFPMEKRAGVEEATVTVEKITFQNRGTDSEVCTKEGVCHSVPHSDAKKLLESGHVQRLKGDLDEAYKLYSAASATEGEFARPSHLHRMALLPPFALTGRCCDSTNELCKALRKELSHYQPSQDELSLMQVFGQDQCEGFFVEVGAGDGVTSSPTLGLEKMMGWHGVLLEGDLEAYKQLSTSGRSSTTIQGKLKTADRPGIDLKEEILKRVDVDSPAGQVQLLVFNSFEVEALRAINFTEVSGYMEMQMPLSQVIAVPADPVSRSEVQEFLESKHYKLFSQTEGGDDDDEEGNTGPAILSEPSTDTASYDIYMYHPPMEGMEDEEEGPAPDEMEDLGEDVDSQVEGEPEVEYHVTHDDDDDEDDQSE